ncbi:MAG: transposase [Oscillibacter sp.]|nr:transposase [Oscillibacter sp.]
MRKYDKQFKEEAVRRSDEVGVRKAAGQLGAPYYTLADWRRKRKHQEEAAFIDSEHKYDPSAEGKSNHEIELERENAELRQAHEISKDALGFFAEGRRK